VRVSNGIGVGVDAPPRRGPPSPPGRCRSSSRGAIFRRVLEPPSAHEPAARLPDNLT